MGTYDLWKELRDYYEWNNSAPGIRLKHIFFDEERNWIDYQLISKRFKI